MVYFKKFHLTWLSLHYFILYKKYLLIQCSKILLENVDIFYEPKVIMLDNESLNINLIIDDYFMDLIRSIKILPTNFAILKR